MLEHSRIDLLLDHHPQQHSVRAIRAVYSLRSITAEQAIREERMRAERAERSMSDLQAAQVSWEQELAQKDAATAEQVCLSKLCTTFAHGVAVSVHPHARSLTDDIHSIVV